MPSLVNGQAPGGGGTVAAADITDSTATGRSVLTGDAAAGRTALGLGDVATATLATLAAQTTPLAGAGFTASAGVGTATPSTLTLTVPGSTVATAYADLPRLTRAHGQPSHHVDVRARLALTGGDNNTFASLRITGASASSSVHYLVQSRGDGTVTVYRGGSILATAPSLLALDGSETLRLELRGGQLCAYVGRGSVGSEVWELIYDGSPTPITAGEDVTLVGFYLYQGVGTAGTVTATWSSCALKAVL